MKRLITGIVAGGGWLALLFLAGPVLFGLAVALAALLALHEYFTMVMGAQTRFAIPVGLCCGFLPLLAALTGRSDLVGASLSLSLLVLVGFVIVFYRTLADPFAVLSRLGLGILYVGFCAAHLILLRHEGNGVAWLLWLTAITIASDSFAYYSGRLLGSRKLCPAVSPGKTVEGFVGGLAGSVGVALLLAALLFPGSNMVKMAAAAAVLSCVGVLGDLCESVIKRAMGVKDSGAILPGHGGVFDRVDSLLLTAPLLFNLVHFGLLVV